MDGCAAAMVVLSVFLAAIGVRRHRAGCRRASTGNRRANGARCDEWSDPPIVPATRTHRRGRWARVWRRRGAPDGCHATGLLHAGAVRRSRRSAGSSAIGVMDSVPHHLGARPHPHVLTELTSTFCSVRLHKAVARRSGILIAQCGRVLRTRRRVLRRVSTSGPNDVGRQPDECSSGTYRLTILRMFPSGSLKKICFIP